MHLPRAQHARRRPRRRATRLAHLGLALGALALAGCADRRAARVGRLDGRAPNFIHYGTASPDGRHVALLDLAYTVHVLEIASGRTIASFPSGWPTNIGLTGGGRPIVYHPAGDRIAAGGNDGVARIMDARTGAVLRELSHTPAGTHRRSPDGTSAFTAVGAFSVSSVAFSADGAWLGTVASDGTVAVWEERTGRRRWDRWVLDDAHPIANDVLFSADGALVVVGHTRGVSFLDARTGALVRALEIPGGAQRLATDAAGTVLAVQGRLPGEPRAGKLELWSIDGRERRHRLEVGDMWMSLGVSPNGRHVAAGDHSMLHVWSVATGEELLATPQDGLDAGREPMQRAVGIAFDDRARLLLTVHQSQRPLAVWRLPR